MGGDIMGSVSYRSCFRAT